MTWLHDFDGAAVALLCAALLLCMRLYVGSPDPDEATATFSSPLHGPHLLNAEGKQTWSMLGEDALLAVLVIWVASPLFEVLYKIVMKAIGCCSRRSVPNLVQDREPGIGALSSYGACDSDSSACRKGPAPVSSTPVEPQRNPAPASLIQEPILTWQMMHPQGSAYNEGWCIWLETSESQQEISNSALRLAFSALFQKHEALRMKFAIGPAGKWTQQPLLAEPLLPHVYFEHADAVGKPEATSLAETAMQTPLGIFDGVCLRAGSVRCSGSKVLFYFVQHHAVTDAVSITLLYNEFITLLRAYCFGLPVPPPQQSRAYEEFARSQERKALSHGYDENLKWWRCHIRGVTGNNEAPKLDLPKDKQPRAKPTHEAVASKLTISEELSTGIQALAAQEGVTVFDVLLALHSSWLCLMARSEDVLVWTSHHGRGNSQDLAGTAGCFRTDLALRYKPCGSFRDFLQTVAQTKREALEHWDVPPGELDKLTAASGEGGHNILTYYSDRYHAAGIKAEARRTDVIKGVRVEPIALQRRSAKADVEVILAKDAHGLLCGHALFASDMFSQTAADRMASHFTALAGAAISDPSRNVESLPLISPRDQSILDEFHGASVVHALPTVVELLSKCVASAPQSVAVEYEGTGEQLTYQQLTSRSWGLAAELKKLGLVPDALVALLLERSVEMVVAIHGVWAAGCAYVPMDLAAPSSYHEVIAGDVAAHNSALSVKECNLVPAVLLTQSWLLSRAPSSHGLRGTPFAVGAQVQNSFANILSLDKFKPSLDSAPESARAVAGEDLAYCIYTSGSTGRPKGVLVPHRGLTNYIHACDQRMQPLRQDDIIMQKTPYIFDVSLYEFSMPLLTAAKLVLLKDEMHKDMEYLLQAMSRCGTTRTRFVPSYFDLFLEVVRARPKLRAALVSLRNVGCSGEAMRAETVRSCLELLPEVELYDLYGPTEASVDVTCLPCTDEVLKPGKKTVGKALSGVQLFVANQCHEPSEALSFRRTPVGLHGELLIGGTQLARGYMNLPDRTAQAFIPNVFEGTDSYAGFKTLYRTGDLVKWQPDGQVTFLGRIDRQVKLSGVRIELGDIEAAAAQVSGVTEVIAKMHVHEDQKQIVLYVTPSSTNSDEVLQRCRAVLPPYMVPSAVLTLDEWPRTGSGKIDTKQLPSPPVRRAAAAGDQSEQDLEAMEKLVEKIKKQGVISALADEDVQAQGWNSFQLIRLHAEIIRNRDMHEELLLTPEMARMSMVGHIWFFMMVLVVLEWLVAYWEWYGVVPETAGFSVSQFYVLKNLNALGRLCGDPIFVMLSAIQDMTDVRDGKTGNLCRRTLLFLVICAFGTFIDKIILQGPYVRHGWVNPDWALDTFRNCGVLNGASFIFVRTFFMMISLFLSMGRCSWISIPGFVEWPWACIAFSVFIPMLLEGMTPPSVGFGNGTLWDYARASKNFAVELTPYYFMYPLLVGGLQFPDWIAKKKARCSCTEAVAMQAVGLLIFIGTWRWLEIGSTSDVDVLNEEHRVWGSLLREVQHDKDWPLLNTVKKSFDVYAAGVIAVLCMCFALMAPATPTHFSLLGTRVIGAYLSFPLTLIAAGHFLGPVLISIPHQWQPIFVPAGVIAILLLCTILPSQQFLPNFLLEWIQNGSLADFTFLAKGQELVQKIVCFSAREPLLAKNKRSNFVEQSPKELP